MKTFYKGRIFSVAKGTVAIRGRKFKFDIVEEQDAVVMLPLVGDDKIVIEFQYRPAIHKRIYELPAGHIEKGESPMHAVKRELREEVGYEAENPKIMFMAHLQPGLGTSIQYFYYGNCFRKGRAEPEDLEDIDAEVITFGKALEMVKSNKIVDAKSIAGILYYLNFVKCR